MCKGGIATGAAGVCVSGRGPDIFECGNGQRRISQVMTVPPNVKHSKYFQELEKQARQRLRGLWELDLPIEF